jgi:putative flavoprotein involved in K+ transport
MAAQEGVDTAIIGGGQAGLAMAYYLTRAGIDYLILDSGPGFGASWRQRWDSLRLFTPGKFDALPGIPFPIADFDMPTKDQAAAYLEAYAADLRPPVRFNSQVLSLTSHDGTFSLTTSGNIYAARRVIVATGAYQQPYVPAFAADLSPSTVQLHTSAYKNPGQIPQGDVLVVGAGNSGAEIAVELAQAGRQVWLAGRNVGRIPADRAGMLLGGRPFWWLISRLLSVDTPLGRRLGRVMPYRGTPLIGLKPQAIPQAGVKRVGRVAGVRDGRPALDDGQIHNVSAVVWATGYRPNFSWIKLPIFDAYGFPRHDRGSVPAVPGLYFIGLPFQRSMTSSLLGGVGADARYLGARLGTRPTAAPAVPALAV